MRPETADKIIELALMNYQSAKATINTDETLMTWLEAFDREDDALMIAAIKATFKHCKFFPTVYELQQQVDALKAVRNTTAIHSLDRPKNYDSPFAKKVMQMMRTGEISKLAAEMSIEPEITDYARSKFPNISDELIRQNYLEIRQSLEGTSKCVGCMWTLGQCLDAGHFPVMSLQSNGWISLTWQRCQKGAK